MAWFVLDESILRRPFGGPHIMRDQLAKLETMSHDTNVVIQIMPLSATSHPGMEGNGLALRSQVVSLRFRGA